MSVAHDLHRLGTEPVHMVLPIAIVAAGIVLSSSTLEATGVGMLLVLLWGNVTYQAPQYRWKVEGQCCVSEQPADSPQTQNETTEEK